MRRSVATGGMAAPLPSKTTRSGAELLGHAGALGDVRARHLAGEASAAAAAPDRAHAGQRRRLQVVGGGVTSGPGQLQQAVERRRGLDQLGLGGAAAAHGDDDDVAVAGEHARELAGERRLPDPLAGADHGQRRQRERLVAWRLEVEVRPEVAKAERERAARQLEPPLRRQHRLVGEVDDELRLVRESRIEILDQRHAVLFPAAQLLHTSDEHRRDELVRQLGKRGAHDVGVVLPVDDGHGSHDAPDFLLDLLGRLHVVERLRGEADHQLLAVVRVAAAHLDVLAVDLDDVVTGPRVAAEAQRGDRARVDDEHVLEPPRVRHVLVAGEHEIDARALEALDRVARVVDDVPLAARARHRQQVVVEDEHAQLGPRRELLLDPLVAAAADAAVVEVGLGRVDRDDGHRTHLQHRVAVAEELLEVDVADVARVVVPGDDDERLALDPVEVRAGLGELRLVAERRQVAAADDEIGLPVVDLRDRALEQRGHEVRPAAVDVGEVRDPERTFRAGSHAESLRIERVDLAQLPPEGTRAAASGRGSSPSRAPAAPAACTSARAGARARAATREAARTRRGRSARRRRGCPPRSAPRAAPTRRCRARTSRSSRSSRRPSACPGARRPRRPAPRRRGTPSSSRPTPRARRRRRAGR